jgi:hypothetical protein
MNENENFELDDLFEDSEKREKSKELPEMTVNDYGATKDSTVVIEEEDRTVMLTEDETIIIEKSPMIDIVPKNRPRKVYGGMWGQAEIATVGLSLLAILSAILLVVFVVFPAQNELAKNKAQRNQLEEELISAKGKYGSISNTETQVAKLITSVDDFETRFLPSESSGRTALYERLNGLIGAYGLVNSSGPDYMPLEIVDPQRRQQAENERGRDKLRSIFPGVFITVTVEGPYQNLRRFIKEIETTQQFIMVSSVEIVPADKQKEDKTTEQKAQQISQTGQTNPNSQILPNGQIPVDNQQRLEDIYRGKTQGEIVSLKIEMAAYFRRPNYIPFTTEVSVK